MTHLELVREVANKGDFTIKDTKDFMKALEETVASNIRAEDGIKLFNGLVLATKFVDAKEGHNPRTGEPLSIPAKYKPVARFGKAFKEAANA